MDMPHPLHGASTRHNCRCEHVTAGSGRDPCHDGTLSASHATRVGHKIETTPMGVMYAVRQNHRHFGRRAWLVALLQRDQPAVCAGASPHCLSSMTTAWHAMERFSPRLSTFSCVLALMFTTLQVARRRRGQREGHEVAGGPRRRCCLGTRAALAPRAWPLAPCPCLLPPCPRSAVERGAVVQWPAGRLQGAQQALASPACVSRKSRFDASMARRAHACGACQHPPGVCSQQLTEVVPNGLFVGRHLGPLHTKGRSVGCRLQGGHAEARSSSHRLIAGCSGEGRQAQQEVYRDKNAVCMARIHALPTGQPPIKHHPRTDTHSKHHHHHTLRPYSAPPAQ